MYLLCCTLLPTVISCLLLLFEQLRAAIQHVETHYKQTEEPAA